MDASGVYGASVGISIVVSAITTLSILGIAFCIKTNREKKKFKRRASDRESGRSVNSTATYSTNTGTTTASKRTSSGRDDVLYTTVASKEPLVAQGINPNQSNGEVKRRDRRTTDYISKWCTEKHLTEDIANILRDNGFRSRAEIDALSAHDIKRLGFRNLAQECLLRRALEQRGGRAAAADDFRSRQRSNSDEALQSFEGNNSRGSQSVLDRTQSCEINTSLQSLQQQQQQQPGRSLRGRRSLDPLKIIGDSETDEVDGEVIVSVPKINLYSSRTQTTPKKFNGLLSDTGLWTVSRQIGAEWQILGTQLGVPRSQVEQIVLNNPHHTLKQIYEMLRLWRDTAPGSKEEVKGALHRALVAIQRQDVAQTILQEQVDGSVEKFVRMTSVI